MANGTDYKLTTWVCPPCSRGWQSTLTAGETCSRCHRPAVIRGSYRVIQLEAVALLDDLDLDVQHMRKSDGSCVISLNGQGHLPCSIHERSIHEIDE